MVRDGKTRLLMYHKDAVEPVWLFIRQEERDSNQDRNTYQKPPKVAKAINCLRVATANLCRIYNLCYNIDKHKSGHRLKVNILFYADYRNANLMCSVGGYNVVWVHWKNTSCLFN
jgi:hypothetical protein